MQPTQGRGQQWKRHRVCAIESAPGKVLFTMHPNTAKNDYQADGSLDHNRESLPSVAAFSKLAQMGARNG
jgi:hypothetical protein